MIESVCGDVVDAWPKYISCFCVKGQYYYGGLAWTTKAITDSHIQRVTVTGYTFIKVPN